MLDRVRLLSSSWTHFFDEYDRFKVVFLRQVEEKKPQIVKQWDVTFHFTDASCL